MFYNEDCIQGSLKIAPESVDLIISDPPFGIEESKFDSMYNRKKENVLDDYSEVHIDNYQKFSYDWIKAAARILKKDGSFYIISGWTNLIHILNAIESNNLIVKNHIIWKYNFGVWTKNKYVSSHYHILYCHKPKAKLYFNSEARYPLNLRDSTNNINYLDREDVWVINKEYRTGEIKNVNQLPTALIEKIIQYSSKENDLICDMFLGSFTTAIVAKSLKRRCTGFEINKKAFDYFIKFV